MYFSQRRQEEMLPAPKAFSILALLLMLPTGSPFLLSTPNHKQLSNFRQLSATIETGTIEEAVTAAAAATTRTNSNENGHNIQPTKRFQQLMDDAILLYSKVEYLPPDMSKDLIELRRNDVVALVEDIVFAQNKIVDSQHEEREPYKSPLLLLSQEIDETILEGYKSTFTKQELEDWVERIESLQIQLETLLEGTNQSPKELLRQIYSSTISTSPATTLKSLESRLEQLRNVIYPIGHLYSSPLPQTMTTTDQQSLLPQSVSDDVIEEMEDQDQERPSNTMAEPKETITNLHLETIKTTTKATTVSSISVVEQNEIKTGNIETEKEQVATTNEKPKEFFFGSPQKGSMAEQKLTTVTSTIESGISLSDEGSTLDTIQEQEHSSVEGEPVGAGIDAKRDERVLDAVSAIIAAASIGAAAVTKMPVVAAVGVALSPLVQASIDFAKSKYNDMQEGKKAANTNDYECGNTTTREIEIEDH